MRLDARRATRRDATASHDDEMHVGVKVISQIVREKRLIEFWLSKAESGRECLGWQNLDLSRPDHCASETLWNYTRSALKLRCTNDDDARPGTTLFPCVLRALS